jgi:hypothetical protein
MVCVCRLLWGREGRCRKAETPDAAPASARSKRMPVATEEFQASEAALAAELMPKRGTTRAGRRGRVMVAAVEHMLRVAFDGWELPDALMGETGGPW